MQRAGAGPLARMVPLALLLALFNCCSAQAPPMPEARPLGLLPAARAPLLRGNQRALDWAQRYWREQFISEEHSLGNATYPDEATVQTLHSNKTIDALVGACNHPANSSSSSSSSRTAVDAAGAAVLPRALVVSPVGDGWRPETWLNRPEEAHFDILAIYYGSNANYSCDLCIATLHRKGPKYRLFADLLSDDGFVASLAPLGGYDYIMFPDDDLTMDTCTINKALALARALDLLVAQPSVCHGEGSFTTSWLAYQEPGYIARYCNFVEIMAPIIRWDYWNEVLRHVLTYSYTGWGLDWVMPYLLGYPKDRVAVLDAVCMHHPPSPPGGKPGGVYEAGAPYGIWDEEWHVDRGVGYRARRVRALGEEPKVARWYYGILGSDPTAEVEAEGEQPEAGPVLAAERAHRRDLLPARLPRLDYRAPTVLLFTAVLATAMYALYGRAPAQLRRYRKG